MTELGAVALWDRRTEPVGVRGRIAWAEFGERGGDPRCRRGVDGDFVVPAWGQRRAPSPSGR